MSLIPRGEAEAVAEAGSRFEYSGWIGRATRADLVEAHRRAWSRLAGPGSWWTGAERVALAEESRRALDCELCARRKAALSPYADEGVHDHAPGTVLSGQTIEMVHRVLTDPARIKRDWVEECLESGLTAGQYVEALGVVVAVFSIDEFHRALGVELEPLPEPTAGEPEGYVPPVLEHDTAWVPMIPADGLCERDSDLWGETTGNVIRAMSLVPDAVRQLLDLSEAHYIAVSDMRDLQFGRTLDRRQIELVAGRVSAVNECFY